MEAPTLYTAYHVHSMLSSGTTNIDSITNFRDYVTAAQECGMTALAISEHGNTFEWLHKKEAIEKAGMKYIHAVEAYLTEELYQYPEIPDEVYESMLGMDAQEQQEQLNEIMEAGKKTVRDNYHCVLLAKNYDGVKELNALVSKSFNRSDGHFYFTPRITFDELFATSDNILVTTACLGGVLNNGTSTAKEKFLGFLRKNKHRCWLEIQHHNCEEQIKYNQYLYELSKTIDVPLIVGTDTHALNEEHMIGREMLQKAKAVRFSNEDAWDLTFKTSDGLIDAWVKQNSLPMEVVYAGINETMRMADMVEEFTLDYSPKYPKLYDDSEQVFKQKINEGVIRRGIMSYPNYDEYNKRIHYEYDTYKHNGAIDFMLLEENYKSEMRRRGVKFGYSRGSVSGSIIAYLLGITEVDSVKYNLNFERFMNKERVSLADVDTDWLSEDRKIVKDYLYQKEGLYCCDIVTFNTIALKGAIKDICRGLFRDNLDNLPDDVKKEVDEWDKLQRERTKNNGTGYVIEAEPYPPELVKKIKKHSIHKEVPYEYLKFSDEVIALAEVDEEIARQKYPELFRYVDLVNGVVVSVGNHPAGCVVSPYPVDEWFGTFTTSTDEYPISVLNMKEIDSLNFVKLDILGLDNIGLIYKTCDAAGIPFATPDNIPADDLEVWKSIREDTTMIFQWESQSATAYLKQLMSDETIAKIKEQNPNFSYIDLLSIGNGAIRPAGESYRDKLAKGEFATYGNKALDEFMKSTLGWMVYQEQIIEFLHRFCGYTMGQADVVRRGFAKKTGTEKFIPDIKAGFEKTMKEEYGIEKEESDNVIGNFIQVIEDASSYLFSKNHSDPYSWIGYICGYLRYYYPLEFITSALNIFEGKEEKSLAIIAYAKKQGIKISPIKFRHSIAKYNFSKETNEIFKGISSIKFMNQAVADEIYELRNNQYRQFIELVRDLREKTSINSRQMKILIELDFFSEFGDANFLMAQFDMFENFNGKKQFRKDKLTNMGVPLDLIRPFATKESEKMFTGVNVDEFMVAAVPYLKPPKRSLRDKITAQVQHLGYIDVIGDEYSGMAAVIDIDTKYSPKVKMYSLKNGTTIDCKIDKKTFKQNKLKVGDIVTITKTKRKARMKRTEDGEFEPIPGVFDLWISSYRKVENI